MAEQSQQKAFLVSETGDQINCLFNPASLSMARSNAWGESKVPGHGVPPLDYNGSNPGTMSFELTFDGTADGKPVTVHTNRLLKLMEIDPGLPGYDDSSNNGRPPWVRFHWGDLHSFKAVIESIDLGAKHVIVDLTDTTFIDSTTLGVLVGGVKRLRPDGGELSVVCSDRNITKIFEITGLNRIFPIHGTRADALESAGVVEAPHP